MDDTERRREARAELREQVLVTQVPIDELHLAEPDAAALGTSQDVSQQGLQLVLDQPVIAGVTLAMWVALHDHSERLLVAGEVRWVQPQGERFRVGVEICSDNTEDFGAWQQIVGSLLHRQGLPSTEDVQ